YSALSYTCGPAEHDKEETCSETRPITLDGKAFRVRPNLCDALLQLRGTFLGSLFWIDAICINQDDAREREVQVGVMGTIYAGASQTIAWLGQGDE
ncbi:heterokaryon incompatibility, partial [Colletotrichum cereale]